MTSNTPYQSRISIVEYSLDRKKPRQHIILSKKQLGTRPPESISKIVQRINAQNARKDRVVQELEIVDTLVRNKAREDLRDKIRQDQGNLPLVMRTPNYYKYVSREFLNYLRQHPNSSRIHISGWRNDVLLFFGTTVNGAHTVAVVHYRLPDQPGFDIYSDRDLRKFIQKSTNISQYEFL
jgi:hypothetical protein